MPKFKQITNPMLLRRVLHALHVHYVNHGPLVHEKKCETCSHGNYDTPT